MNMEELKKAFGKRVRLARQETGTTQAKLSERTGLAQSYISQLERGDVDPSLSTMAKLSDNLGIPPAAFFMPNAPHVRVSGDEATNPLAAEPNPILVKQAYDAGVAAKSAATLLGLPKTSIETAEAQAVGRAASVSPQLLPTGR